MHFLKKINGWHRLGILLSVLWALIISGIALFGLFDSWGLLVYLAVVALPIIAGWLGTYCVIWAFRLLFIPITIWVRKGFRQNDEEMKRTLPETKSIINKEQKLTILIGVGIIVLMGLIPPWYYHALLSRNIDGPSQPSAVTLPVGYRFLFSPPGLESVPVFSSCYNDEDHWVDNPDGDFYHKSSGPCIDLSRLLIQWAVIAFATAAIVFALKDRRKT